MPESMKRVAGQIDLPFRGGKRRGAGRPRKPGSRLRHGAREPLAARFPVHVTLRMKDHVWNLRSRRSMRVIGAALEAGGDKDGFHVPHFSVQGNHIHLVVEAASSMALSRGMQGLAVRIAKRLTKLMGVPGKVFDDRYHARILRSPWEVQ